MKRRGTRAEVFNGQAMRTSGGLKKEDIVEKQTRYLSRKKIAAGKVLASKKYGKVNLE